MTATANFSTPTGVVIMIEASNAKALRAELTELGVSLTTGGDPAGTGSSTITPAKQQAARDSTAAGKAEKPKFDPNSSATQEIPREEIDKALAENEAKKAAEALAKLRTDVSAKIVKLAGMNQDAAVTLLAGFNAKRAKEISDAQLPEALAAVDKALASADMG